MREIGDYSHRVLHRPPSGSPDPRGVGRSCRPGAGRGRLQQRIRRIRRVGRIGAGAEGDRGRGQRAAHVAGHDPCHGKARTVYDFANDTTAVSTCTGACAADWPFVPAPSPLPASLPGVTGKLGASTRPDGGRQLTVAGHPVYTFAGDSAPGDTHGQGQTLNGGLWTVVSPAGAPLPDARPAGSTQNSGGTTY
jgi:predicted lipoprotein with Yx(FWY)xxD motif